MSILGLLPENAIIAPESQILYGGRNLLARLAGRDAGDPRQGDLGDLPGADDVAEPGVPGGRPDRRGRCACTWAWACGPARERAIELLNEVGIPNPQLRVNSFPHEMSGGQQQRVMIAMAIACEPKLLIADEPTTALDVTIQKQILDLIASLQEKHHMSVLFITHDLGVVGDIADTRGGDAERRDPGAGPGARRSSSDPQHPYTKALLACRPRLDRRPKRLPVIDDFMKGDGTVEPRGAHARHRRRTTRSSSR